MQHVLITGAGSGIGAALARAYAKPGVRLTLCDVSRETCEAVAAECVAKGAVASAKALDITDRTRVREWVLAADAGQSVDLVIANAGIAYVTSGVRTEPDDDSDKTLDEIIHRVMDVNVNGVMHTILPLVPRMKERRSGQIVVMSSLASFLPAAEDPAYSASKAAVRFLAQGLRARLHAYGVRVNAVTPGFIATPLTDAYKKVQPFRITLEQAIPVIISGIAADDPIIAFPVSMATIVMTLGSLPTLLLDTFAAVGSLLFPGIGYMKAPAPIKKDTASTAAPSIDLVPTETTAPEEAASGADEPRSSSTGGARHRRRPSVK